MNRFLAPLLAAAVASILIVGCTQAQPAASPTSQATAATGPAQTAAPAAVAGAPTQALAPAAKQVDFPSKGRPITVIVTAAAGGSLDVTTRIVTSVMEKELGAPIQIVNKSGANSQIGMTEGAAARPDGYTLVLTPMSPAVTTYLDPDRKAIYTRKSFEPLGTWVSHSVVMAVKTDSPFKSVKDVIDAAKAKPGEIKVGDSGSMGGPHFGSLGLQRATDTKFAIVHFESSGPALNAVLGEHIDVDMLMQGEALPQVKSENIRVLGIFSKQEVGFLPGVKTMESMGYGKVYDYASVIGMSAPAGTPKEVIAILSAALKTATDTPDVKAKLTDLGYTVNYMDPQQYSTFWASQEEILKPLVDEARQEALSTK